MASVTLRLPDTIVHTVDLNARGLHISRSEYIKKAILEMNHDVEKDHLKERLAKASHRVREESMKINAEFEAIESDPKA